MSDDALESPPATIVFVGLPGSGKSTVGRLVAEQLNRRFVDLDVVIERLAGRTIPEIFAELGESEFRRLEREATAELSGEGALVVAPGAGWLANPGALESLDSGAMLLYLRVSPGLAAERLAGTAVVRPLIQGANPRDSLEALLRAREKAYEGANHVIDTEALAPQEVAERVVRLASWTRSR